MDGGAGGFRQINYRFRRKMISGDRSFLKVWLASVDGHFVGQMRVFFAGAAHHRCAVNIAFVNVLVVYVSVVVSPELNMVVYRIAFLAWKYGRSL